MNNFLKNLFGLRTNDDQRPSGSAFPNRDNNEFPGGASTENWNANNDADDIMEFPGDDFESSMSNVGFSVFNNPFEINKIIDSLVNDMQKNMRFFGFFDFPNSPWEEEKKEFGAFNYNCNHETEQSNNNNSLSLRNSYLKSPDSSFTERKKDIDLDGKVKAEDVENFLSTKINNETMPNDNNTSLIDNYPQTKIYSQSVYIRTVRHPDGSIETIKKMRDHTGKEETIITRDSSLTSSEHSENFPNDDASGISIFKKFFPF